MNYNDRAIYLDDACRTVVSLMVNAFNGAPVTDRKKAVADVLEQHRFKLRQAMYAVAGGMVSPSGHVMTEQECEKMVLDVVTEGFMKCQKVT